MTPQPDAARRPYTGSVERAASVLLRTLHLVAVVALGAALLGAPLARGSTGAAAVVSGLLLMALDLRAGRLSLREAAGVVVLVKLAACVWIALDARHGLALFWLLVVLSSLSSHAPKALRHWRLGGRRT
jgi:energy-converting hydrogenase Eha subunit G